MGVTIVCICHNQAVFVREALQSILRQTVRPHEIWVLDDASIDGSRAILKDFLRQHPEIRSFFSDQRMGHTRIFNHILSKISGEFLIDLAADDLLMPERIQSGLNAFRENPECGVNFTNARLIDASGNHLDYHYPIDEAGHSLVPVPEGDVFARLVGTYFINPVSMMVRTSVLKELGGYDSRLSYEDFDFWVRSSRNHPYCYTDEVLVTKRIHSNNYSAAQYRYNSIQMRDTFRICRKISHMIRTAEERQAFYKRIGFEMRQCIRTGNLRLLLRYLSLF